jgi:hypothetical protein
MKTIEQLIQRMINEPDAVADGQLANRLLDQFHRGAPLDYLRPLLSSPDPTLASSAAWIASELGEMGKPLLDAVLNLLEHPDKRVRFWIIDCLLLWAEPSNGFELSRGVRLIDDPEKAVRWKTMVFLSRASRHQLEAALSYLTQQEAESKNIVGLRWLLSVAAMQAEAVETMLRSADPRMRKYGAIAAARMASDNRGPRHRGFVERFRSRRIRC